MRQRWKTVLGGLVICALSFYAGGFFGAQRAIVVIEPMMRSEVQASINLGVDELLYLRTGSPDKAMRRMEWRLDGAILGLARDSSSNELSPADRQSLLLAKKYRARYPFEQASPEAQAALAAVPDGPLDPLFLKTAARLLMQQVATSAKPAEP